ncbi:O-antigen ligase family protein [Lonepinella sp. BR2474]|uniref:O-antigen ligase family protein n=1 Tax=Lonepinella sp. BR2474 TaxID=3434548 RepID=UPI003F6DF529
MNLSLDFIKQNKILTLTNASVGLFFLTVLLFKGSHNIGFALLVAIGIIFAIYHVVKKQKANFITQDKWITVSFVFYVLVFLLSLLVNGGKMSELDNPSRALLVLPLILLFIKYPPKLTVLLTCIPIGATLAGIVALTHRFVLHYVRAFQYQMQIQAGDMAMSLGMFSFAIALYFAYKKHTKLTALCFIASLCGILASLLSTARGGWVGVPVILVVIFWVYRKQVSKKVIGIVSTILVLLIAVAVMIPQTRITQRIQQMEHDITVYMDKNNTSTSLGARFDMWKSAVLMAKEKPLLGWGAEGSNQQRKEQAKQKLVNPIVGHFTHAHNQYLDDLSKRGILGLLALLGILLIPLRYFWKHTASQHATIKLTALLGTIHIISVIFYGLSQGFFAHNSGTIFYFLVTMIFYGALKEQLKQE